VTLLAAPPDCSPVGGPVRLPVVGGLGRGHGREGGSRHGRIDSSISRASRPRPLRRGTRVARLLAARLTRVRQPSRGRGAVEGGGGPGEARLRRRPGACSSAGASEPGPPRAGPTAHGGRHDGKRIALSEERGYERGYGDDPSQPVATSPNPSSGCRGLWKRESPRVERDFGVWRAKEMVDRGRIEPESGVELVTGDDA
jgi:hypothetical protein